MGLCLPACAVGSGLEPSSPGPRRGEVQQQSAPRTTGAASLPTGSLPWPSGPRGPCSGGWKRPASFLGEPVSSFGPLLGRLTISIPGRLGIWQEETLRARDGADTPSGWPTGAPPACFTCGRLGEREASVWVPFPCVWCVLGQVRSFLVDVSHVHTSFIHSFSKRAWSITSTPGPVPVIRNISSVGAGGWRGALVGE